MKYIELVNAVNEILGRYTVQLTLRQVYYRLVAGGLAIKERDRSECEALIEQLEGITA